MNPRDPRRALRTLAGPLVIVLAVLIVLHDFVFSGLLGNADAFRFFLPNYCLLGKSLAAGHIPAWNPYTMGGVPFAADPQTGWMYVPAMALFSALPCDVAIRFMLVLQPILAGLGMYAFLRSEGVSRPAATVGGLAIGVAIAGSELVDSIPFAGVLAWTTLCLAAMSKAFRSSTVYGRLGWSMAVGAAWGQLVSAHFSMGVVIGTLALAVYGAARAWRSVREERWRGREVAAVAALIVVSVVLINPALIVPRITYLPSTSLGLGYRRLLEVSTRLGHPALRLTRPGVAPTWPLQFAVAPGAHLGAVTLGLALGGWRSRRYRPLAMAFGAYGALLYVASLRVVANAVPPAMRSWRLIDVYLHRPEWVGYGLFVAIPVLGAIGFEAWREARSWKERALIAGPAGVAWLVLPVAFGAPIARLGVLVLAAAATAPALVWMRRRPRTAAVIPAVLAVELVVSGLLSFRPPPFNPMPDLLLPGPEPTVHVADVVRPGPISEALTRAARSGPTGRVLIVDHPARLASDYDPAPILLRYEQVEGFNPVELERYWTYVRALAPEALRYNISVVPHPTAVELDLLQVGWFQVRRGSPAPESSAVLAARQGVWDLYRRAHAPPQVSLVTGWTVVGSSDAALRAVAAPGFDPTMTAVLETDAGLGPSPGPTGSGAARVESSDVGRQEIRITIDTPVPGIVLARTTYAPNWRATVDGQSVRVFPADYLDTGVYVGPGRHVIVLSYRDDWIGLGLLGSAVGVVVLVTGAIALRRRTRHAPQLAAERVPVGAP